MDCGTNKLYVTKQLNYELGKQCKLLKARKEV